VGEIREFRVGDIDRARSIIRILRAKVRPSGGPRGLQEHLPDLQLAVQGIQRLRKALSDILAKAADALLPRMKRIVETLAADWRRLDERVDEVSTGIAGAEGGSLPEAAGIGPIMQATCSKARRVGPKVSWLSRSAPCSMLKWVVM
jgi:hypothetical protein